MVHSTESGITSSLNSFPTLASLTFSSKSSAISSSTDPSKSVSSPTLDPPLPPPAEFPREPRKVPTPLTYPPYPSLVAPPLLNSPSLLTPMPHGIVMTCTPSLQRHVGVGMSVVIHPKCEKPSSTKMISKNVGAYLHAPKNQ